MAKAKKETDGKIKVTIEQLKNGEVGDVQFNHAISYADCFEAAQHIVEEAVIAEDNIVYWSIHRNLYMTFWLVTYFSNIDTEALNDAEGRIALYDYIVGHDYGNVFGNNVLIVKKMTDDMFEAIEKKNNYKYSASGKILDALAPMLLSENAEEEMRRTELIADKLGAMIDGYQKLQSNNPTDKSKLRFSKK